jgi:hypothetical protein
LRRLYSTFPGGLPGVGLLLLRAAIGLRLLVHASAWMGEPQWHVGISILGLLVLITGISFLLGLLTPLAGVLSAVAGIAVHIWHPSCGPSLVSLLSFNTTVMAVAISFLGPGALSLDAHFFGRRKIIIPRGVNS